MRGCCCLTRLQHRLCLMQQRVPRQLEGAARLSTDLVGRQHAVDGMLARITEQGLQPSTMPEICLGSASAASCHKSSAEYLAEHMSVNSERLGDHWFCFSASLYVTLDMQGDCALHCSAYYGYKIERN